MKVDYILVASGHVVVKQINIAIFEENEADAIKTSEHMVKSLCQGPYFAFTLFNVATEDHFQICSFTTEQPEPVVTTRMPRK